MRPLHTEPSARLSQGLIVTGADMKQLAESHPVPFTVFNEQRVRGSDRHRSPQRSIPRRPTAWRPERFQDRWSNVHQDWIDQITDDYPRLMEADREPGGIPQRWDGRVHVPAVRLLEMRRVLKPTGSIYLHCDPTASLLSEGRDGRASSAADIRREMCLPSRRYRRSSDILRSMRRRRRSRFDLRALSAEEANAKFVHPADEKGRYFINGLTLFRRPAHGPRRTQPLL